MRARFLAAGAVAAGIALMPGVALAAPVTGYSGEVTGPADSPGGYTEVLTTASVDATGAATATVSVPGAAGAVSAKINAPAGSLPVGAQIVATKPDLSAITPDSLKATGFDGYKAVAGIGVKVKNADGSLVTDKFAKPISVTLTADGLGKPGQKAIMFNGAASASVLPSSLSANTITITLDADPNIAVIDPINPVTATAAGTVPNATASHTGIPTTGIYAGAGALAVVGAGALMASRRRAVAGR